MWVIKIILLFFIFTGTALIGIMLANKYKNRTKELYELKKAFNYIKSKIEYTYEPIKEIFIDISYNTSENISNIFSNTAIKLDELSAEEAWLNAINTSKNYLNKDDIEIIKDFGKTLGQTDKKGQIDKTNLTLEFLDRQILDAENEQDKNEKLYKTLGIITGMGLVIILI